MKKICFVTASPLTLRVFMRNHLLHLSKEYEVTAVANFRAEDLTDTWLPGVRLVPIPISRKIDLSADFSSLLKLLRLFHKERFDAVHSVTPKAGLLAMIAARIKQVRYRTHCFTGQVWRTRTGVSRVLLKKCDQLLASCANHILVDSLSQLHFLERERVVRLDQAKVLGFGSISGVDLNRFSFNKKIRISIRAELNIPANACLILFVGRLNRDKGVLDLVRAFTEIAHMHSDVWLMVAGPDEGGMGEEITRLCGDLISRVRMIGFTSIPEYAMSAADVFVLPSYREGFGTVVIEAAACGLPAVASRIYGLTDAVEEDVTGLLYPPGDILALQDCLLRLCRDKTFRHKIGNAARMRVEKKFSEELVTTAFVDFYKKLFASG